MPCQDLLSSPTTTMQSLRRVRFPPLSFYAPFVCQHFLLSRIECPSLFNLMFVFRFIAFGLFSLQPKCVCVSECSLDRVTISFCIYTHSSLPFLNTYTRNSIFARALPLALICSSLSICLRLSWEILTLCQLHGNEYFFFLRYFRRVRIAFRS